jgi:hypothetical protein
VSSQRQMRAAGGGGVQVRAEGLAFDLGLGLGMIGRERFRIYMCFFMKSVGQKVANRVVGGYCGLFKPVQRLVGKVTVDICMDYLSFGVMYGWKFGSLTCWRILNGFGLSFEL